MIIDHIGIAVGDYDKAKAFYQAVLAPLGIAPIKEVGPAEPGGSKRSSGFGRNAMPRFWIHSGGPATPMHVAFSADTRDQVHAFYEGALAAGAVDNGPPGIRPNYQPNYYGAFVIDPEGHNIEAVCHKPG